MVTRGSKLIVVSLVISAAFLAGCAKRPATAAVSVPAPTAVTSSAGTQGAGTAVAPAPAPALAPPTAATQTPTPTARPSIKEFAAVPELKPIYFDFDKYDIRPADAKVLDANAQWLKSNDQQLVLIEGHCDERGTNEYNLALGERRAKSTMNYLVSQGVQASRITIISYGEERPVCAQHNEECWSKNRRAQFLVKPR